MEDKKSNQDKTEASSGWVERFGDQLIFARSPFSPLKLSPSPIHPQKRGQPDGAPVLVTILFVFELFLRHYDI